MFCEEFIQPSKIHESLFVGYLWKNPKLFKKYKNYEITKYDEKTNMGTIVTDMWYFYYILGKTMIENGVAKLDDDTTVYSFISSQPKLCDKSWIDEYNQYGGFASISTIAQECSVDSNNDSYHFNEIQKYELLRKYENQGLLNPDKIMIKKGKKIKNSTLLCKMPLESVKSYFQYNMKKNNSSIGSSNIKLSNFSDGIDDSITNFSKGVAMGLELYNSPRLNRVIKGWQQGNFIFLVLASGVGKSTFTNAKFDLGIYESKQRCVHFVNEENKVRAHHTMLATVSGSVLNDPITRDRLSEGYWTEEEKNKINKARDWIKSKPSEQIKFGEIQKFLLSDVIDTTEMLKSLGYNYMILDTFKPDSSKAESARWEKFGQHAQDLFDCIKPTSNNIGTLATLQLKIGSEYKYLDLDCIGKAREPVEVADIVLMGRLLFEDEYDGQNLFVYDIKVNEETGLTSADPIKLDKDLQYMILFIPKNRNGSKSQQIVYQVNYDTNTWTEIGYAKMGKKSRKQ